MRDVDSIWEFSVLSAQFYCEYKTAVRNKVYYKINRDIFGGPVVRNLPADAGDTSLIPGPGRSHVPQSS